MTTRIPRRYFLIPAVYIVIIAALLAVEFTGTVRVQENFANVSLTAVLPAKQGGKGQAVYKVDLDMDGFVLAFERQKPLEFRFPSGRSQYAPLTSYALLPGAIEVYFGDHLRLLLHSSGSNQSRMEIISDLDETAELVIPYTTSGPVSVDEHGGLPLLKIGKSGRGGDIATAIALPPGSTIDMINRAFILRNDGEGFSDFYVHRFESGGPVSPTHWFQVQYDFPRAGSFDTDLTRYLDRAYRGWTSTRYSRSNGTWSIPAEQARFDENLLNAALTESVKRGTFADTVRLFRTGTTRYQDLVSWQSSPHLGDIVSKGGQIESSDLELIRAIRRRVSNEDLLVFGVPDLLSFARDRAPSPLFRELANFAARARIDATDVDEVLSLLEVYLESLSINDPLTEAFARFRPLVEDTLLTSLTLTDRGLLFRDSAGRGDVLAGIRAASILIRLSSIEANQLYERVGKELLGTVFALADQDAILPAALQIDDRMVIGQTGTLRPEDVYTKISGTRYFPHQVSLSAGLGTGTWAWTSGGRFEVRTTGTTSVITFEYPIDGTHHFVVKGIEPFSGISFFGIQWKSDPRFQFYRSGWLYDETTKSLYVKITHSDRQEELVITH